MKNPGRVKSIFIEKLFGLYDHRIRLKEERVTVLHGPNGVGKTTLLKLVYAVLSGDFKMCGEVPFLKLEITFENGMLSLSREGIGVPKWRKEDRPIVIRWEGEEYPFFTGTSDFFTVTAEFRRLREVLGMLEKDEHDWVLPREGTRFTNEQVESGWEEYYRLAPLYYKWDPPTWFASQQVKVIHTDRLFIFEGSNKNQRRTVSPAVDTCATRMKTNLEGHLAIYATESEQLERSLPFRLADSARKLLSPTEISQQLQQLNQERKRLQDLDLLADDTAPPFDPANVVQMDSIAQAVMSLYVRDTAKKLENLADIARRLEIFREAINSKFLDKRVEISRSFGLRIVNANGEILELSELSSGEQHELLLLFELLFETPADTLVLIDEPELSMHPSWKRTFLRDVLDVAEVAKLDVVLATHSVQIVNGRDDLMVALSGDRR